MNKLLSYSCFAMESVDWNQYFELDISLQKRNKAQVSSIPRGRPGRFLGVGRGGFASALVGAGPPGIFPCRGWSVEWQRAASFLPSGFI